LGRMFLKALRKRGKPESSDTAIKCVDSGDVAALHRVRAAPGLTGRVIRQ
jgi:hypothetical protein